MVNLPVPTKSEVSTSTRYEDMKGNAKCKEGGLWYLWVTHKVIGNSTI